MKDKTVNELLRARAAAASEYGATEHRLKSVKELHEFGLADDRELRDHQLDFDRAAKRLEMLDEKIRMRKVK